MSGRMKVCELCGKDFKQAPPPKAEQRFCSYACHVQSRSGRLW